jgi:hypothetical protein
MKKFIVRLFYWIKAFLTKPKFDLAVDSDWYRWGDILDTGSDDNKLMVMWRKRRNYTGLYNCYIYRVVLLQ